MIYLYKQKRQHLKFLWFLAISLFLVIFSRYLGRYEIANSCVTQSEFKYGNALYKCEKIGK